MKMPRHCGHAAISQGLVTMSRAVTVCCNATRCCHYIWAVPVRCTRWGVAARAPLAQAASCNARNPSTKPSPCRSASCHARKIQCDTTVPEFQRICTTQWSQKSLFCEFSFERHCHGQAIIYGEGCNEDFLREDLRCEDLWSFQAGGLVG